MQPSHIDRPLQREPRLLDEGTRRAEEQFAFHERYHNRMSQLLDGEVRKAEPAPYTHFRDPAPNYWADYTRKLEEMGVVRDEASAIPPPSCVPGDTSSVLGRLDCLARERDEPDAADVIELLREVEDVLEREKDTERPETIAPGSLPPPPVTTPTTASSFRYPQAQCSLRQQYYPQHHQHQPLQTPLQQQQQYQAYQQAVAASNGALAGGGGSGRAASFPQPADWSRMSSNQQMEWYRVYYAWMVYYAQYYGAALASQQQQQQQQQQQVQGPAQEKSKNTARTLSQARKTEADIRKLTQEYSELAAEVEGLKEKARLNRGPNPPSRAASLRPAKLQQRAPQRRSPPNPREQEEEEAPYRSEQRGSHMRMAPPRAQSVERRAPPRDSRDASRENSRGSTSRRFDPPWLPPRSLAEREEEEGQIWYEDKDRDARAALPHSRRSQSADRDIAWLYKYEEEEEEGEHSDAGTETGTREGRDNRWIDGHAANVATRRGQGSQREKGYISVYERKRQELKKEKPRWTF